MHGSPYHIHTTGANSPIRFFKTQYSAWGFFFCLFSMSIIHRNITANREHLQIWRKMLQNEERKQENGWRLIQKSAILLHEWHVTPFCHQRLSSSIVTRGEDWNEMNRNYWFLDEREMYLLENLPPENGFCCSKAREPILSMKMVTLLIVSSSMINRVEDQKEMNKKYWFLLEKLPPKNWFYGTRSTWPPFTNKNGHFGVEVWLIPHLGSPEGRNQKKWPRRSQFFGWEWIVFPKISLPETDYTIWAASDPFLRTNCCHFDAIIW